MIEQAKLLIADDNKELCRLLTRILSEEGYRDVRTAYSCREAWRQIEQERPDLMILDVNFPGEDGFSFFQRLKSRMDLRFCFCQRETATRIGSPDWGWARTII